MLEVGARGLARKEKASLNERLKLEVRKAKAEILFGGLRRARCKQRDAKRGVSHVHSHTQQPPIECRLDCPSPPSACECGQS